MKRLLLAAPLVACVACASAPPPCAPCAATAPPVVAVATSSPELDALARRRVELARTRVPIVQRLYDRGTVTLEQLWAAEREVALAAHDSRGNASDRARATAEYRDFAKKALEGERERYAKGAITELDLQKAEYNLAEAEYWAAEAAVPRP